MKYLAVFLFLNLPILLFGQQEDPNTFVINEYFNINNSNSKLNISTLPKLDTQSNVNLMQTGNENSIIINSLQSGDNQVVSQKGNQNNYEYYNYYSQENSNLFINQEGNKNSLQVFGENSLMKNAVINQKSNFKSLVIKNYTN